jgi:molecular chaperone HscB
MNLSANFFELFGLPLQFALDSRALDQAYLELQSQVHPDRFADQGDAERRLSMQWATRANEAYKSLKKPLARATYLLQLRGVDLQTESNTAMPADFLLEQMEWREAVEEARQGGDHHELEQLHHRLQKQLDERYQHVAELIDLQRNDAVAAVEVRKLMFLDKLLAEIDDAIAALEDA